MFDAGRRLGGRKGEWSAVQSCCITSPGSPLALGLTCRRLLTRMGPACEAHCPGESEGAVSGWPKPRVKYGSRGLRNEATFVSDC